MSDIGAITRGHGRGRVHAGQSGCPGCPALALRAGEGLAAARDSVQGGAAGHELEAVPSGNRPYPGTRWLCPGWSAQSRKIPA